MDFNPKVILRVSVGFVAKELSNDELAALNLVVQLDSDPRHVMGYDKARALFTETRDGHPSTHAAVKDALASIALARLPAPTFELPPDFQLPPREQPKNTGTDFDFSKFKIDFKIKPD